MGGCIRQKSSNCLWPMQTVTEFVVNVLNVHRRCGLALTLSLTQERRETRNDVFVRNDQKVGAARDCLRKNSLIESRGLIQGQPRGLIELAIRDRIQQTRRFGWRIARRHGDGES